VIHLSPRERQVVGLIGCLGWSYKAAARELGLSRWTVITYARRIAERYPVYLPPRVALARVWMDADQEETDISDVASPKVAT